AARCPLLVPTLRVVDEPAPPERQPGLTGERPRPEAFQLDAARKPVQARSLESEQVGNLGLGARRYDQPRASARPTAQPLLPGARVAPGRRRSGPQSAQER